MWARYWFLGTLLAGGWLASSVGAQQAVRWQPTLQVAKQIAEQSNRLVLVHFWGSSCTACLKMEQEVFSRPEVAAALEANYVPVKLNADYFPNTARQYGVTALPTDVILTPQGQALEKVVGFKSGPEYIAAMNWIASKANAAGVQGFAQSPAVSPQAMGGTPATHAWPGAAGPPTAGPATVPSPSQQYAPPAAVAAAGPPAEASGPERWAPRAADERPFRPGYVGVPPSPANPYTAERPMPPAMQPGSQGELGAPSPAGLAGPPPSTAMAAPSAPAFGLDGYCPVSLSERKQWVRGDRRWGVSHQGKTYVFAGPEEQQRFLTSPEVYAPVLAGNDAVLMVDQGQAVPGQRRYGAWYGDRVYLFSSEANLQRFSAEAHRYSNAVLQSLRPTPNMSYR